MDANRLHHWHQRVNLPRAEKRENARSASAKNVPNRKKWSESEPRRQGSDASVKNKSAAKNKNILTRNESDMNSKNAVESKNAAKNKKELKRNKND